jgi:hypothetical protein
MEREGIIFDGNVCQQADTIERVKEVLIKKWEALVSFQNEGAYIPKSMFDELLAGMKELGEIDDATRLEELREELDDIMEDIEDSDE